MAEQNPLARYSFLPWLRQGLASSITPAGIGGARAKITVEAVLKVGGSIPQDILLHGPGDVLSIDPRAIVRIEPRHAVNDFEPNYVPVIEFFDEDFPWRYTPDAVGQHERLRPWICLVVLTKEEFESGVASATRLATITLNSTVSLPSPQQTWAWAHVHVARDVRGQDGTPAQVLNAVRGLIKQDTTRAISRLICPRRLKAHHTYYAMVIPTFETGRLAGLGKLIPDGANGLEPAWGSGQSTFPVYYQWSFHTGEDGDFESLVRRLTPEPAKADVGKRPMDVQTPAPEYNIPPVEPSVLKLEGALKAPHMTSTAWPNREPFLGALTNLLNMPADFVHAGDEDEEDDPLIVPPLYGQWPAEVERVAQPDNPVWFNMLNLDPRHRTAAGFGTRVIQTHQEDYMHIAWQQAGMIREANNRLRYSQYAYLVSSGLVRRHLSTLTPHQMVVLSASLHRRVLLPSIQPNTEAITAAEVIQRSSMPAAMMNPALRRILRPRGAFVRRTAVPPTWSVGDLIARIEASEITPAPPKPAPEGGVVLDDILQGQEPKPAGCLSLLPVRTALGIFIAIVRLLTGIIPSLTDFLASLEDLYNEARAGDVVDVSKWTPEMIDQIPPAPDFTLIESGTKPPPRKTGLKDSDQAAAFRAALKDTYALFAATLKPQPVPPPLPVKPVADGLLAALAPSQTINARMRAIISGGFVSPNRNPLDELWVTPDFPEAMYKPLRDISHELLLPNADLIPPNTITLLKTNQKFIEAYMVGLNHEMAREFVWREYPALMRATFFRQFWAGRETPPNPNASEQLRAENVKDILPIAQWQRSNELGWNNKRLLGKESEFLVLLFRGDLFRRYPQTEVYAAKAVRPNEPVEDEDGCLLYRLPESDFKAADPRAIRWPVFKGELGDDIRFFGFDLKEDEARGDFDPEHPDAPVEQGWFFAIREHPGEPRFGLDEPVPGEPMAAAQQWNDLSWAHVAGSVEAIAGMNYIDLSKVLTGVNFDGKDNITWNMSHNSNAATLAYIMLQDPYKMYVHADEMLPQESKEDNQP